MGDCDWRKVTYVCSIMHLVLAALMLMASIALIAASASLPPLFRDFPLGISAFYFVVWLGQTIVDVFLLLSTNPQRIAQNRSQCHCRVAAFLIYSVLTLIVGGTCGATVDVNGMGVGVGFGGTGILFVLWILVIPFACQLRNPAVVTQQQFPYQTPSQMGNPNMYNPNPNDPNAAGGYPQMQQDNQNPQQQGGYPQQRGGYPQQGGWQQQQGGYQPQQQQQGGYYPQQQQQGGYYPQQGGYYPQQGGYYPQQQGGWQQQSGYPQQGGYGYPQQQQGGYQQPQQQQPQQGGTPQQQQPNQGGGVVLQNPWASSTQAGQK